MFEIEYQIGGKKCRNVNQFTNEFEKAILKEVTNKLEIIIKNAKCPKHNSYPKVVVNGRSVDQLNFEFSGCCQELIDTVY